MFKFSKHFVLNIHILVIRYCLEFRILIFGFIRIRLRSEPALSLSKGQVFDLRFTILDGSALLTTSFQLAIGNRKSGKFRHKGERAGKAKTMSPSELGLIVKIFRKSWAIPTSIVNKRQILSN